jgi:hypothetical protein
MRVFLDLFKFPREANSLALAPELRERVADAIKLHLDPMEYQRLQTVEAAERDRLFKRLRL